MRSPFALPIISLALNAMLLMGGCGPTTVEKTPLLHDAGVAAPATHPGRAAPDWANSLPTEATEMAVNEQDVDAGTAGESVPSEQEQEEANLPGPPYPVVLIHGFTGWSDAGGFAYFFRVLDDLADAGHTDVRAPALPPYNNIEMRALILAAFVDELLAESGHSKVHLIGHSQGGLDARYLVNVLGYGDRVASLTTIGTPHHGTPLADAALLAPPGMVNRAGRLLAWFIGAVDDPPNDSSWEEDTLEEAAWAPSVRGAFESLSTQGAADFNDAHPDPEDMPLFSVAAYSNLARAPDWCATGLWEKPSSVDAMDPLMAMSGAFLSGPNPFHLRRNDGLVPTDSMSRGVLLGCIPADHFDQMGQIADLTPGLISGFNHLEFYRKLLTHIRTLETSWQE